ncbi:MAG: FitA-like ribbon-helix-helix domain-containing protein [Phenylobacterium sp.]
MATIILENLPDNLVEQLQKLAQQNDQSVNEQIISILQQAVEKPQTPLKFLISPATDPTREERRKAVPQLQAQIDQSPRPNPLDYGFPDSTELIRENREKENGYPPGFFERTYGICADDPIVLND